MADSGYAAAEFIVTPYKQPAASLPHNAVFNELFSSARCKIEHVNGILKNRFMSLKGIRTQVNKVEDFKLVNNHVVVCLILHNILMDFRDEWEYEEDEDDDEENIQHPIEPINASALRARVHRYLLDWYFNK